MALIAQCSAMCSTQVKRRTRDIKKRVRSEWLFSICTTSKHSKDLVHYFIEQSQTEMCDLNVIVLILYTQCWMNFLNNMTLICM